MELEISFTNGNIKLSGILALPDNNSKNLPAFVLVHGSGPIDRNENPDFKLMSPDAKEAYSNFESFQLRH